MDWHFWVAVVVIVGTFSIPANRLSPNDDAETVYSKAASEAITNSMMYMAAAVLLIEMRTWSWVFLGGAVLLSLFALFEAPRLVLLPTSSIAMARQHGGKDGMFFFAAGLLQAIAAAVGLAAAACVWGVWAGWWSILH